MITCSFFCFPTEPFLFANINSWNETWLDSNMDQTKNLHLVHSQGTRLFMNHVKLVWQIVTLPQFCNPLGQHISVILSIQFAEVYILICLIWPYWKWLVYSWLYGGCVVASWDAHLINTHLFLHPCCQYCLECDNLFI